MKLLALAAFVVAPTGQPASATHEKMLHPHAKPLAEAKLPLSIWRLENGQGIHRQSTLVCPAKAGRYQLSQLVPFDNYGLDVGCSFVTRSSAVTIYMTRRNDRDLAGDLEGAKAAIKQFQPDVKPVEGEIPSPEGMTFAGALYTRGDGLKTGVWVADVSGWTLKYRATYGPSSESDAVEAMSALTSSVRATAALHLAACAAAPPVARAGVEITDKDKKSSMAIAAAVGFMLGPKEASGTWCAENPAPDSQIPMLFWRNVADDGSTDRVSLMTIEEPPMLISSENSLLKDDVPEAKGPVYQLTAQQGTVGFVFGFFDGRPSNDTLSPVAKDVFLGNRKPLAAYDTKTNTMMISANQPAPAGLPVNLVVRQGGPETPFLKEVRK